MSHRLWKGALWNADVYGMPEHDPAWREQFHANLRNTSIDYGTHDMTMGDLLTLATLPRTQAAIEYDDLLQRHEAAVWFCRDLGVDPYEMRDSTDWSSAMKWND
jgi:hypothetical protein